jgi:hypothetical protein
MECDVIKKNLGVSRCNKMPEMLVGMITTPNSFSIPADTLADAALLLAYLNEAILAPAGERIYYWPDFKSFENISTEAVYEDTPLAYLPVRDGAYRFRFGVRENLCLHKAMYTHRANSGRVIFIDSENQLILTELADGSGAGFTMQLLHTEKLLFNDGSVSSKSPILVALQNNKELDKSGVLVAFDQFSSLQRIVDLKLTLVGSPTATTIVVKVAAECDATPLTGLVLADFLLIDDDNGATHAITTAVENTAIPGQYTLTGTGFETSHLSTVAPDALTVQAYETLEALAIVIGALLARMGGEDEGRPEGPEGPGGSPDRPEFPQGGTQPGRPVQKPGGPSVGVKPARSKNA